MSSTLKSRDYANDAGNRTSGSLGQFTSVTGTLTNCYTGAKRWRDAGFKVAVVVSRPEYSTQKPTPGTVERYAKALKRVSVFDWVSLGNEVNIRKYWFFSFPVLLSDYITPFIQGWGSNENLIAPSVTYNYKPLICIDAFKRLRDAGCISPFKIATVHAYQLNAVDCKTVIDGIRALGITRIVQDEWNIAAGQWIGAWKKEATDAWNNVLYPNVEATFIYRGIQKVDSTHGLMSPVKSDGSKTDYYETIKAFKSVA